MLRVEARVNMKELKSLTTVNNNLNIYISNQVMVLLANTDNLSAMKFYGTRYQTDFNEYHLFNKPDDIAIEISFDFIKDIPDIMQDKKEVVTSFIVELTSNIVKITIGLYSIQLPILQNSSFSYEELVSYLHIKDNAFKLNFSPFFRAIPSLQTYDQVSFVGDQVLVKKDNIIYSETMYSKVPTNFAVPFMFIRIYRTLKITENIIHNSYLISRNDNGILVLTHLYNISSIAQEISLVKALPYDYGFKSSLSEVSKFFTGTKDITGSFDILGDVLNIYKDDSKVTIKLNQMDILYNEESKVSENKIEGLISNLSIPYPVLKCLSTGSRFIFTVNEYCVLIIIIEKELNGKATTRYISLPKKGV